jgi:hypothetical protein
MFTHGSENSQREVNRSDTPLIEPYRAEQTIISAR